MVMMTGRVTSPDSLGDTMFIKVLRGCVGNKERLVKGQVAEIPEHIAKILIQSGMAEETDPPKKKAAKKKAVSDASRDD